MSEDIYHERLMALARSARTDTALDRPDGRASLDNPLCGDQTTVMVALADNRVKKIYQHTRGCILCRAASAAIGLHAEGLTPIELRAVADGIAALLTAEPPPTLPWPELATFLPARRYPSRHSCVLLPFEGLRAALSDAERRGRENKATARP